MVPSPDLTRRRFLSVMTATGTATIAGCSWDQPGATDVVAMNLTAEPKVVSITITSTADHVPPTSRTLELAPYEKVDPVNDGKLPTNASYTVDVTVENGPEETFEWDDPDVQMAPLWVLVDDSRNIKFVLQVG